MTGTVLAIWFVALSLHWVLVVKAFRWLHSGRTSTRRILRRIKSRADAYQTIGFGGLFTGFFLISPATGWPHWVLHGHAGGKPFLYMAPALVLPVILLVVARLVENTWRPAASQGPGSLAD